MPSTRRHSSTVSTASWKDQRSAQVSRTPVHAAIYPRASRSFIGSIHNVRATSGLFENAKNFSRTTHALVYEFSSKQSLSERTLDENSGPGYLQEVVQNGNSDDQKLRVMCRLSLSAAFAKQLMDTFDVTPQFSGAILGEPDYGAPGDFATFDDKGNIEKIEFCCQQPRWAIHKKLTPWCIYMAYSYQDRATTYIVACDAHQGRFDIVKERLSDLLAVDPTHGTFLSDSLNPFFLHLLITQEVFLDAVPEITKLRHQLYGALDRVDQYAAKTENEREKKELEDLTITLHIVSQETDRMFANVSMSSMILQRMIRAHARYQDSVSNDASKRNSVVKTDDALHYMFDSIESQQRWLNSYKSRKDIAMNLVFNLVTQQDSSTSTTIAREAKADGSAMRTIATLTMVFLPGTFVSSVFSMPILEGVHWHLYVAVTIPLTLFVFVTWWFWQNFVSLRSKLEKLARRVRGKRASAGYRP
ncbi:uncharacterized protein CC84DRAFT_1238264 [Paraphaeosphaeria sporulosa]|uniref:Cora-domain-containing protein n=1 Tax=Paraphaeosphaeria sporulosa TaxID=1460663 RepID=A0A177CUW4_9PLEO|nr:uncharacterized protein CC84DRAFT_1238264 [Paraphaeosphaeria sporulosa]OAG11001.1 hypothetical protein CC84DRAFT_1238264 [Paraphaeosphaeria sporulosa]